MMLQDLIEEVQTKQVIDWKQSKVIPITAYKRIR